MQINTQVVPPSAPLIASMPSGRDIHSTKPYQPPVLDMDTLAQMRAPPDSDDSAGNGSSSSSDGENAKQPSAVPGAFPGGSAGQQSDSYY